MTQVFGVRGKDGDLYIEPKLSPEQFNGKKKMSLGRIFAGRDIEVSFLLTRKARERLKIIKVSLDAEKIPVDNPYAIRIPQQKILSLSKEKIHTVELSLG